MADNPGPDPASRRIVWILNDFPPFILIDGKLPGEGFSDAALRYIVERLPEYQHHFEVSTVARALGLMEQGVPVCHPTLLMTPEREKRAEFSGPVHFMLAHRVVLRREQLPRFRRHLGADGSVNLRSLLADTTLTTSLTEQRAYADVIEKTLADLRGTRSIKPTGVHFEAPFLQLAAGWIDYAFAYPIEPGWYKARDRIPRDLSFVMLPIAGSEDFALGRVGCTKGDWGREVTVRINQIVAAAGPRPPWIDATKALSDAEGGRLLEQVFARSNPFRR